MSAPYEPWLNLTAHPDDGVVEMVRTAVPFASLAEVAQAYGALIEELESLSAQNRGLLTDLRAAPGRNDPAFEEIIAPFLRRMYACFDRRAIVIRSAIGKLQVRRHAGSQRGSVVTQRHSPRFMLLNDGIWPLVRATVTA